MHVGRRHPCPRREPGNQVSLKTPGGPRPSLVLEALGAVTALVPGREDPERNPFLHGRRKRVHSVPYRKGKPPDVSKPRVCLLQGGAGTAADTPARRMAARGLADREDLSVVCTLQDASQGKSVQIIG